MKAKEFLQELVHKMTEEQAKNVLCGIYVLGNVEYLPCWVAKDKEDVYDIFKFGCGLFAITLDDYTGSVDIVPATKTTQTVYIAKE